MKYKVGDRVRVRSDLKEEYYGGCYANNEMVKNAGSIVKIKDYDPDGGYEVYSNDWTWTDAMFIGLADEVSCGMCKHCDEDGYCSLGNDTICNGYPDEVLQKEPSLKCTQFVKWEKREEHVPEPTKKIETFNVYGSDCNLKDECKNWNRYYVPIINNCRNTSVYDITDSCSNFKQKQSSTE